MIVLNKALNITAVIFAFVFPLSIAAANIILGVMLILWIAQRDWSRKFNQLKNDKILLSILGITTLLLISTLFSNSIYDGFALNKSHNEYSFILKRFVWLSMVYVIFVTSVKREYLSKIITAFLVSMFINELISYATYFHLIDIEYWKAKKILYHELTYNNPAPMHHSFYSIFLVVTIFLLLTQLFREKNIFIKAWILLFLSSSTINLFVNGGRTGQLAFVLASVVYSIVYFKEKIKYMILMIIIVLSIVFTAYKFSPIFKNRVNLAFNNMNYIYKNNNYNTSWGARVALDIVSWRYLTQDIKYFIFGAGAGDAKKEILIFSKKYPNLYKAVYNKKHLHNQYFQFWVDGSIFALILFLYLLYSVLKIKTPNRALQYALITVFVFAFISDLFIYRTTSYILFLFVITLFTLQAKEGYE